MKKVVLSALLFAVAAVAASGARFHSTDPRTADYYLRATPKPPPYASIQ